MTKGQTAAGFALGGKNFAAHGDPNGPGVTRWPAFTAAEPLVMRIGVNPGPAPVPSQDRLKVLDACYDWRRGVSNQDRVYAAPGGS
jgi:hypothetical protein